MNRQRALVLSDRKCRQLSSLQKYEDTFVTKPWKDRTHGPIRSTDFRGPKWYGIVSTENNNAESDQRDRINPVKTQVCLVHTLATCFHQTCSSPGWPQERKDTCIHSCSGFGISMVYISFYSIKCIHSYYVLFLYRELNPTTALYAFVFSCL
jgi:hypothetical protein